MGTSIIAEFVEAYIDDISAKIAETDASFKLSKTQREWLSFCLTGLFITNEVNWSAYCRQSLGSHNVSEVSWMFRHSNINFELLFRCSIMHILSTYGITSGHIIFDDTDNERSKNAEFIHALGKQKDKKSGGFFLGQNILFMLLVTDKVTIPIGFKFFENDPAWVTWKNEDNRLRKLKVPKAHRPKEVERNYTKYPTKQALSLELLKSFKDNFPTFKVLSVIADCFYGTKGWTAGVKNIYKKAQVLSQLKSNQLILFQGGKYSLDKYFKTRAAIQSELIIRGGKTVRIYYSSIIATVKAHGAKRLIIAMKYEGESEFRYIFAEDLSWTPNCIMATYTLRWLVEVFISDWKKYEGWAVLTKHIGDEGSRWTLILSLLFDHCLLLHPEQQVRIKNKLPTVTVGSLREKCLQQHFIKIVKNVVQAPNAEALLVKLSKSIDDFFPLRDSKKHMSGKEMAYH